ncbi:unnamed protein product [Aphis gossypii]|uniref:Uncharacterized protein n=1 Tax=Aphis gossypii TaxID=80765 RepID=A0A9P0JH42_APHGO|nr:unnamed protein product [Aphis gossypii]
MAGQKTLDEWRVLVVRRGSGKIGKNSQTGAVNSGNGRKRFELRSGAAGARKILYRAFSSFSLTPCASGSRRDHRAHAIQFSETGSRASTPSGETKRGRAEYFCYYYYYYFITILLSFKFVGSDPGRNIHTVPA